MAIPKLDIEGLGLEGRHVLCAVSGGADSVALLRLLCQNRDRLKVTAAHFEHGIRGAESLADMEFVINLCRELNVDCICERGNAPLEAQIQGEGLESAARRLRHAFLLRTLKAVNADAILTAHHAGDRAETVLMHMLRGSGISGAAALKAREGVFVRPLLDYDKEELKEYLISLGQTWREDSTNLVADNPRNSLRLKVLPLLKEVYPGAARALSRFADIAGAEDEYLNELTEEFIKSSTYCYAGIFVITKLPGTAIARRVLRTVLPDATYEITERARLCKKRTQLPCGAWADRYGDGLFIGGEYPMPEEKEIVQNTTAELKGVCSLTTQESLPTPLKDKYEQVLSASAIIGSRLRLRREGDYICPFGMDGRTKSLGDYLTDKKFPAPLRSRLPVIARGDEVLWVPGVGISENARLVGGTATKCTLCIDKSDVCLSFAGWRQRL